MKKSILAFIVGIVLTMFAAYYYINYLNPVSKRIPEMQTGDSSSNDNPAAKPPWQNTVQTEGLPTGTDLFTQAKTTNDDFTYLVSAPKYSGEWKMFLNDSYTGGFSFSYKYAPWGRMRFSQLDLTASDSGAPLEAFKAITAYDFCAGEYYCDLIQKEGMGFELKFWNVKYSGEGSTEKFYLQDGETLVTKNDKYIVTYKPFTATGCQNAKESESCAKQQEQFDTSVAELFKSFELFKK